MKKSILLLIFGLFIFILNLVLAILSFEKYNDGFGIDYSIDYDYIIFMLVGIIISIMGIVSIIFIKNNNNLDYINIIGNFIIGIIIISYSLNKIFKLLYKNSGFSLYTDYIIYTILGGFILSLSIISYIDYKKIISNKE